MKTVLVTVLILSHSLSTAFAQSESAKLDAAAVFSSDGLLAACDTIDMGNFQELPMLVRSGVDLNEHGTHGCTLLLWSWCQGYDHAFETLLEMGADPHATLESDLSVNVSGNRLMLPAGSSVAAIAIRFSQVQPQFVEKTVRYLRDANQRDARGKTLLHDLMEAADDKPIVRQVRDAKQHNPEALKNFHDELALYDAWKTLQPSPFALLYQAGVPVMAVGSEGLTALQQYMQWLDNAKATPRETDNAIVTAIMLFNRTEYFDDVERRDKFILALKGLVKDLDEMHVSNSMLKAYKETGQDYYDLQRAKGRVWFGDYAHFLFVEMYDDKLDEEVCLAIEGIPYIDRVERVRTFAELREVGFDVNKQGKAGLTHLFTAYTARNAVHFEALLKMGADPDVKLESDLWPYVPEGIQILSGVCLCPERGESVLLSAALNPDREPYLRLGIEFTKNIDIRDDLNRNMLHRMLYHRLPEAQKPLISELVQAGVDINAQSIGGATPCHEAVFRNASIIPELVALGADPNIRDLQGRTVRDVLRQSIEQKWTFHEESSQALDRLSQSLK